VQPTTAKKKKKEKTACVVLANLTRNSPDRSPEWLLFDAYTWMERYKAAVYIPNKRAPRPLCSQSAPCSLSETTLSFFLFFNGAPLQQHIGKQSKGEKKTEGDRSLRLESGRVRL
jgi:hypothetical protein